MIFSAISALQAAEAAATATRPTASAIARLAKALCVIFMILVSHENVKKCVLGGCMITSETKINVV